jgi:HD-GYP domain-containing protein (c-di-GMP phosphodiesterase class II)
MRERLQLGGDHAYAATAVVLVGAAVALVVLLLAGDLHGAAAGLLLAVVLVGGAGALFGWRRAERVAVQVAAADEPLGDELERERRAHATTRAWVEELRDKVLELQRTQGLLGTGDVRELVLHTAMSLLDADRGLLLSRQDEDADGDLDLVCEIGFERDPEHNPIAQRFAREVLRRDQTVREEHVDDALITNLVAIPLYLRDSFNGVVVCCNLRDGVHAHDDEVLLALGDHASVALHNSRLHGELRGAYLATVAMLADAIQAKDPLLGVHSNEVAEYVCAVADRLGFAPDRREELMFASVLHDVGKIGVSEAILIKPGALTAAERAIVEAHPGVGYRLVQQVPALRQIAPAILHHHERWDGSGYPSGLTGDAIPLEARIICIADSFCAMTADRPYRGAMSLEEACTELERCAGTQFDPEIVRLFVEEVRARRGQSTTPQKRSAETASA